MPYFTSLEYINEQFTRLTLTGEVVEGVLFEDCTFTSCTFNAVTFKRCTFTDCTFVKCQWVEGNLQNTSLNEVAFSHSHFRSVQWSHLQSARTLQFTDCELAQCSFAFMELPFFTLKNSIAREVDFMEANCTGANFEGTDLHLSIFQQTNLTNASFVQAKNYAIDCRYCTLKGATFDLPEAIALLNGLEITLL